MPTKILILNGPNLNLLGTREPGIYGSVTLADIEKSMRERASSDGVDLDFLQSNAEHVLVDRIQKAGVDAVDFVIINPGAFTHTSVAIRDALLGTSMKFIELHLSNVHAREAFRHHSYLSDVAVGIICGLGSSGYRLAYEAALEQVQLAAIVQGN